MGNNFDKKIAWEHDPWSLIHGPCCCLGLRFRGDWLRAPGNRALTLTQNQDP